MNNPPPSKPQEPNTSQAAINKIPEKKNQIQ